MDRVFVYWDNSNIFHAAQRLAGPREGPDARYRVRIDFDNLLQLAHADRPLERAVAAGSIPPEMRHLWNWMESRGIEVKLFDRGSLESGEQDMPDRLLQLRMLEDALDYNGDPGIVVLLTGDGAGYLEGAGFHRTLERMHKRGWRIEILSWAYSCNQRMLPPPRVVAMHRSPQPPELIDAWLPPRVGRNARLERLTQLIDWAPLEALVADLHAAPVGRPSYPPLLMVKVLLLQQWYQASDPAMEEALWERLSFRRFVGLGLQDDAPDHSTISRFRTRLTTAGLAARLFAAVEQQLAARGLLVMQGTLLDARLGRTPRGVRRA